ncbi:MAG TPA: hypothetical protein VMS64_19665 [Candidatus Methylomirabilis sp.]|nr:hypothetical protein [Candidatus Methylomirabilis sp.]
MAARCRAVMMGLLVLGVNVAEIPRAWGEQSDEPAQVATTSQGGDLMLAHHPQSAGPHPEPGALAAEPEEKSPNAGRISLAVGADWVSDYYYRGILFQPGNNVQQYVEVRFRLLEDLGPLTSLTLAGGNWNDFRSSGSSDSTPKWWFEANLYAALRAVWWNVLTTSVTYIYYDSPNDSFNTQSDITVNASLNDSKWLGAFALNPSVTFAFQVHDHFVPSAKQGGIYMALGLAPGYTFFKDSKFPVNVSAPMTFGFSVRDYYTTPDGHNQTWGYFQGGPQFTVPLKFVPKSWGQWTWMGGVQFLELGNNLKQIDGRTKNFQHIGTIGLSMTY